MTMKPGHPSDPKAGYSSGVNAKNGSSKMPAQALSTPGRAGLVSSFYLKHSERVAATSEATSETQEALSQDELEAVVKTNDFYHRIAKNYQGTGELPDWAKYVSREMKQYFRLLLLSTNPDAKAFTIRLDHELAESALMARRGPANFLAEIIKRLLSKLGIKSELAFNIEFNHTSCRENHPLHIHGVICIPDHKTQEVVDALKAAMASGYRQRYENKAVLIEASRSPKFWASYCIKEYEISATTVKSLRASEARPDYATRTVTQEARSFYEAIGSWLSN